MSSETKGGMPPAPPPPDDRLLEEFLEGRGAISETYHTRPLEAAPPELGAQVREMARQELAQRRRWFSPARLAIAASLVLTLGLGVELGLLRTPNDQQPAPTAMMQTPRSTPPTTPAPLSVESRTPQSASAAARADSASAPKASPAPPPAANAAPAQQSTAPSAEQTAVAQQERSLEGPQRAIATTSIAEARKAEAVTSAPSAGPTAGLVGRLAGPAVADQRAVQLPDGGAADQPTDSTLPAIQGLMPGQATRAEVQARLGEPDSKGVADAETDDPAAEPPGAASRQAPAADATGEGESEDLNFDFYAHLPGHPAPVEFYYERMSTRLVAIRLLVEPALTPEALRQQLGWAETPMISDAAEACEAPGPQAAADEDYPRYWHFSTHGAYWVEPEPNLISEVILRAACTTTIHQPKVTPDDPHLRP